MLLYVPNLVGYIRIILFCIAALHTTTANPLVAYFMYLFTFVCDGIDGVLARRLNQVSLFGAFLDVTIDIAARGYLWVMCAPHPWGFFALFTEMLVFVCTHAVCIVATFQGKLFLVQLGFNDWCTNVALVMHPCDTKQLCTCACSPASCVSMCPHPLLKFPLPHHQPQSASAQWKDDLQASGAPWLISKVMENGFRSLPGVVVVYGLMGTPLWLFANKYDGAGAQRGCCVQWCGVCAWWNVCKVKEHSCW